MRTALHGPHGLVHVGHGVRYDRVHSPNTLLRVAQLHAGLQGVVHHLRLIPQVLEQVQAGEGGGPG